MCHGYALRGWRHLMVTKGAILYSRYWRYPPPAGGAVCTHEHDLRLLFLGCANHKSPQHMQTGSIAAGDEGGGSICGGMSSPGRLKYLARRTLEQCFLAEAVLRLERGGKLACTALYFFFFFLFSWHVCLFAAYNFNCFRGVKTLVSVCVRFTGS